MFSDFRVLRGERHHLGGIPLVILNVYSSGNNRLWHGEYFILISGQNAAYYAQKISIDAGNLPEDLMDINEDYVIAEIRHQVDSKLWDHLFKLFEKYQNELYLSTPINLIEGGKNDIVQYWMRGEFQNEISKIKQTTGCEKLSEFLLGVIQLPCFKKGHE